ncbi:truB pseudouridylate synthase family protein [Bordetella holmesii 35009]|nr:truB pseudouridylate synthase family protein [Bordetella holmesii 35009]
MGRATKISGAMLNADKTYCATLQFGEETDSGDLTGNIVARADPGHEVPDEVALREVLSRFQGSIEQIPPMYSALKRDGKPLYEYARAGIELERPPRRVTIYRIELLSFTGTRPRSMWRAVKGLTSVRWPRTSGARWVLCPPGRLAPYRVGPFSLDPRSNPGCPASDARPQGGLACAQ